MKDTCTQNYYGLARITCFLCGTAGIEISSGKFARGD